MALKAYPLNDTDYTAEDAQLYTATRTSGVYAGNHFNISVTGTDNDVTIKPGMGWMKLAMFQGIAVANTEDVTINAGVSDSVLPRIDAVVYAYDANANTPEIIIKQGETGTTPTPPAVVRDDLRHELHLYHIRRKPGATAITPGDITDLRMDANYCGLMADSVAQIDMSAINAQVREFITDWESQIANVTDGKMIESPEYPGCHYRMNLGVKEWLNPPMMEDVEYPTTKRLDGKRVYTKLLKARSQAGSVSLPDIERIVSVFAVAERDWNGEKVMFQLPVDYLPKDSPTIQKMQIYYQDNKIVFQSVVAKGLYNLYITVEYTKSGDEVAYTNVTADDDNVIVDTNGDFSTQGENLNVEMFTTVSADGGAYIRRLTINGVAYDLAVGQAGSGAPGTAYPGIPGMFYTNIDSGAVYVCLKANPTLGVYVWSDIIPENLYVKNIKFRHDIGVGYAEVTADKEVVNIQNNEADAVVRGVATPVNANDATNKEYVDQLFSGSGGNASETNSENVVTPEMFGAKGDGETDDSTAIQAAIDSAGANKTVRLDNKVYVISTGLVISTNYSNFECFGEIKYTGSDAALTLKNCYRVNAHVRIISAENGTAVKLDGTTGEVYSSNILVDYIRSSKIGIDIYTNNSPICYNTFRITELTASNIGVKVISDASFANENRYYINHIGGGCTYGIYIKSANNLNVSGGFGTNDNKFFACGLEGIADDGCAILIDRSFGNHFRDMRCAEGYGSSQVKFVGLCKFNDIELNRVNLQQIDISEMEDIGGDYNILRSPSIRANERRAGTEARVSKRYGITYDPTSANNTYVALTADTFADKIIQQLDSWVLVSIKCDDDSLNGETFTLGLLYSGYGSMACGYPLAIKFGTNGKIKLNDVNGNLILDNTSGEYSEKTVSVRWNGYDHASERNIWDVQTVGG